MGWRQRYLASDIYQIQMVISFYLTTMNVKLGTSGISTFTRGRSHHAIVKIRPMVEALRRWEYDVCEGNAPTTELTLFVRWQYPTLQRLLAVNILRTEPINRLLKGLKIVVQRILPLLNAGRPMAEFGSPKATECSRRNPRGKVRSFGEYSRR